MIADHILAIRFLSKKWPKMPILRVGSHSIIEWLINNDIPYFIPKNSLYVFFNTPSNLKSFEEINSENIYFYENYKDRLVLDLDVIYRRHESNLKLIMDPLTEYECKLLYSAFQIHIPIATSNVVFSDPLFELLA